MVTPGALEEGRVGGVLAARRAAQVAATPAGVKVTRLATCWREGTDAGFGTSSARAMAVAGRLAVVVVVVVVVGLVLLFFVFWFGGVH